MKKLIFILSIAALAVGLIAQDRVLVRDSDGAVLERREQVNKTTGVKWLALVQDSPPAYDPATQRLVRTNIVTDTTFTRSWVVVDLTQQEIDDNTAATELNTRQTARRTAVETRIAQLRTKSTNYLERADATTNAEALTLINLINDDLGLLFGHEAQVLEYQFGEQP